MCQCCQSFFCGIATALDNLFACPNSRNGGCGCNGGNSGCGCNNNGYGVANAVNNLFQSGCGCNNGNNGCGCNNNNGCGCDVYYAQQYALGPLSTGCNVCGY